MLIVLALALFLPVIGVILLSIAATAVGIIWLIWPVLVFIGLALLWKKFGPKKKETEVESEAKEV